MRVSGPQVYGAVKRSIDVLASAWGLVALSPLLGGLMAAVKLDSDGPALFGHERVGRGFRRFKVWKLRTMVRDAERKGGQVTAGGDPRVTRLGRWLRRTKLDELPQLYNVLVGEMSLVGPRPEAPRYVEMFADDYQEVLTVRPGITDEASLEFRHEEEVLARAPDPEREYREVVLPRKIALYRQYVRHCSLSNDVSIVLRTVWKVVAS